MWLLLGVFKEWATASERYQCAKIVKENVQLLLNIFFLLKVVRLLLETFHCFLMNVRLLMKDINERQLLKEKKLCFLRNYVHLINILKRKTD